VENRILRSVMSATRSVARSVLPVPLLSLAKRVRDGRSYSPPVGGVRFGDLRRVEPISRQYGYDRGRPIDRYYIENFLEGQAGSIRGRVLEIGEDTYTRRFGRDVEKGEILHVSEDFVGATYIDDLTDGASLPSNAFDCVILTQTLHLIYDMRAALSTIYRILKPGGTLLATVPGITQISDAEWNDTWYWSLSLHSARRLCGDVFPRELVEVDVFGNVLSATAFLHGLADTELSVAELDVRDPEYPVTITIKATTAHGGFRTSMTERWNYSNQESFPYDDETSYRKGMEFLDGHGRIEDWGAGTAYAKRFVSRSAYAAIDGSSSQYADAVVDLQTYTSTTDCIFMRHVLEHNWGWRAILKNALASFRRRMTLIVFTPFGPSELNLADHGGIPDLALNKQELLAYLEGLSVREETIQSRTEYGTETIFYVERARDAAVEAQDAR